MGRCVEFGDILPTEHFPSFPMRFATLLVDDVNVRNLKLNPFMQQK